MNTDKIYSWCLNRHFLERISDCLSSTNFHKWYLEDEVRFKKLETHIMTNSLPITNQIEIRTFVREGQGDLASYFNGDGKELVDELEKAASHFIREMSIDELPPQYKVAWLVAFAVLYRIVFWGATQNVECLISPRSLLR